MRPFPGCGVSRMHHRRAECFTCSHLRTIGGCRPRLTMPEAPRGGAVSVRGGAVIGVFCGSRRRALRALKSAFLAGACLPICVAVVAAAPPAPAIDSWAGPYIGAYFTAAAGGHAREATDQFSFFTNSTRVVNGSPSGAVTGSMVDLFVGRNWRFGNFVVRSEERRVGKECSGG